MKTRRWKLNDLPYLEAELNHNTTMITGLEAKFEDKELRATLPADRFVKFEEIIAEKRENEKLILKAIEEAKS